MVSQNWRETKQNCLCFAKFRFEAKFFFKWNWDTLHQSQRLCGSGIEAFLMLSMWSCDTTQYTWANPLTYELIRPHFSPIWIPYSQAIVRIFSTTVLMSQNIFACVIDTGSQWHRKSMTPLSQFLSSCLSKWKRLVSQSFEILVSWLKLIWTKATTFLCRKVQGLEGLSNKRAAHYWIHISLKNNSCSL